MSFNLFLCFSFFFSGHSLCFWQVCEAAWTLLWVRLTVLEMLHDISWCLLCHVTCNFETSNHIRYRRYPISNQLFTSDLGTSSDVFPGDSPNAMPLAKMWMLMAQVTKASTACMSACQKGHMVSLQVPCIGGQAVCLLFPLCAQHNLV